MSPRRVARPLGLLLLWLLAACGETGPTSRNCEELVCASGVCRMEAGVPVCGAPEGQENPGPTVLDPAGASGTGTTRVGEGSSSAQAAFSLTGRAGQKYRIRCEALTLPDCTVWLEGGIYFERTTWGVQEGRGWAYGEVRLPADGTYFLSIKSSSPAAVGTFRYSLVSLGQDDRAGIEPSAPRWEPSPQVFAGQLEVPGDVDALQTRTEPGHVYRFQCDTPVVPGTGGFLSLWRRGAGEAEFTMVLETGIAGGRTGFLMLEEVEAAELFAAIDSDPRTTAAWSYACALEDLGVDVGDTDATAAPLPASGEVSGLSHGGSDLDVFAAELVAGHGYTLHISEPSFVQVRDPEGQSVFLSQPELSFKASVSGRYTLRVGGGSNLATPYLLRLTDVGTDDHPDTDATARAIDVPLARLDGRIEISSDKDVFSFPAARDYSYRFTCTPETPGGGCSLRMQSSRAVTHGSSYVEETCQTWMAAEVDDRFFVEVSSYANHVGDYHCQLEQLPL